MTDHNLDLYPILTFEGPKGGYRLEQTPFILFDEQEQEECGDTRVVFFQGQHERQPNHTNLNTCGCLTWPKHFLVQMISVHALVRTAGAPQRLIAAGRLRLIGGVTPGATLVDKILPFDIPRGVCGWFPLFFQSRHADPQTEGMQALKLGSVHKIPGILLPPVYAFSVVIDAPPEHSRWRVRWRVCLHGFMFRELM